MAKRKHRKQPKRIDSAMPAPPPEKLSSLPKPFNLRSALLPLFIVLLITGTLILVFYLNRRSQPGANSGSQAVGSDAPAILETLSRLNFTGMEPQVVDKIKMLNKEAVANPQSALAWGRLGMNLDVHDLKKESIPCYKQAAALDPNEFRWPYYCANVLYESGSPDAIAILKHSLTLRPDYAPAHLRYGQVLFQVKRLEEAAQEFNRALELDPKSSHAHLGLARIDLANGNLEAARTNLQKALESNPKHGEVHGLLVEVYRRLNMPEEAQRELAETQRLPKKTALPDKVETELSNEGVSSYWYEVRGRAYLQQGSYEAAVSELKKAVQAAPETRLHDVLGATYLHMRNYQEAIQEHRAALALNPESVRSMNNLAAALFEMGQASEAILWLKKAIQVEPNFAYSYYHLGRLFLRTGNRMEAIQVFQKGHAQVPGDPQLALQLAWLLATASEFTLRNGTRAVQMADVICQKEDYRNPECLDVLAAAFAEIGEFNNATKYAARAYNLATASGETELANRIQAHLKYYKSGSPYHE